MVTIADTSKAPRIALHAHELGFVHPVTRAALHWISPLAADLAAWWDKLKV